MYGGKVVFMFQVTCLGWLIFRAESMGQITGFLNSLVFNMNMITPEVSYYLLQIGFLALPLLLIQIYQIKKGSQNSLNGFPVGLRYVIYAGMFYAIVMFGEYGSREFIYFQF